MIVRIVVAAGSHTDPFKPHRTVRCWIKSRDFVESRSALRQTILNGKLFDAIFFAAENSIAAELN